MAKFRAIEKGYYGDVIHDPETDHHVIFEAPDDWKASWAVLADADAVVEPIAEVSKDTADAEQILETEAAVAASVEPGGEVGPGEAPAGEQQAESDDIPPEAGESDDVNEAAGVEVL